MLKTEDIIKIFGISKETLFLWLRTRLDFPKPIKVGRRNLWPPESIDEFFRNLKDENLKEQTCLERKV